jgi:radical SAM protein with 4Fe4S-binding SPASM domain
VGRREYFGSLFYDFEKGDYIPFDWDATYIFELRLNHTLDEIAEKIKNRVSKESFLTFVQLCQSIELFDKDANLNGELLPHMPMRGRLSAPLRVHLQVTNHCELACRHCSQESRDLLDNELSLDEIYRLIDQMASIGTFELALGGGDPLLREKDLAKIIKRAVEKNVGVFISTTGLFLGRVMAKKLTEYPLKGIRISFDGSTEKSFDYQRGKGSYRRVVRSIKTLRELFDCPITLHTVMMNSNYTETASFLKMVQKLKCNEWSVDFARNIGSVKANSHVLLTPQQMRDTFLSIQKLQKYSSTPITFRHFPLSARGQRIYRGFGCAGGNLNCWIDARGNVFPCSFLREQFNAGNIREHTLRDIWIYSASLGLFRSISGNATCKECNFTDSCRGGCRARAIESGSIDAVDPACFITQNQ